MGIALLTGAFLTPGNEVELAIDGDGTFPRLWEDLRPVERFILVQTYSGSRGRVSATLRELLLERARAGVRVLVLYDGRVPDRLAGGCGFEPRHANGVTTLSRMTIPISASTRCAAGGRNTAGAATRSLGSHLSLA